MVRRVLSDVGLQNKMCHFCYALPPWNPGPGCIIELDHEGGHRGGGIAKLSGVLNQKILKLYMRDVPYVPKLYMTSKKF